MAKLCCIFNIPSLYREAIYMEIDAAYDCEWYFENEHNDINLFDIKRLKKVHMLEHGKFVSRFYRMKGLVGKLWNRPDFDAYLIIGVPMCVSIWLLCILLRVFRPKKKIYFWHHGWYGKETFAEAFIKKTFIRLAHEHFIYGNYARNLLVKQGFDAQKLHVIHNSLSYDVQLNLRNRLSQSDVYDRHFGNHNPVLLFIGRLTAVKRLDMLLDAVYSLRKRGESYNIVFVGDGIMKQTLENRAKDLGILDLCWFYGACYDESVNAELVYNADLCVSPGNVGLTAMHSLMFGTPVITHDNFAYQMPEFESIRPGNTGDFFKYNDEGDLAIKISEWFHHNRSLRDKIRSACFREIDEQWNPGFQMNVIKSVLFN